MDLKQCQSKTGTVIADTHRFGLEPDKKGSRDKSAITTEEEWDTPN